MFKIPLKVIIFFSLLATTGQSALATDFLSPRTAALGGSGHAAPLLNDAIYLNPSYTSFLPTYSVAAFYQTFSSPTPTVNNGEFYGRGYNVSLQDGRSELFQAGVGFSQREDASVFNIGASRKVVDRVGVGIGAKFLLANSRHPEAARDLIFSSSVAIASWFQSSVIIDNLIESQSSINRGLYRQFTLGTKFNIMNIVMIYFDPHLIPSLDGSKSFGHELGMEFGVFKDLFLRVGNFRNSFVPNHGGLSNGFGTGIGWMAPRISLDYGFSRVISSYDNVPANNAHTLGATVYF